MRRRLQGVRYPCHVVASGIRKLGAFDLIICGKQASDGDTAQVGPGIAVHLGLPQIVFVRKIVEVGDGRLTAERMMEEGFDLVETPLPAVVTVVKEINEPRMPSLKGKMRAKKVEIRTWGVQDLGIDPALVGLDGSPTWVEKVFTPPQRDAGQVWHGEPDDLVKKVVGEIEKLERSDMAWLEVVAEKCVGCGACLKACPYDALALEDNLAVVKESCTLCGACVDSCPYEALVMRTAAPAAGAESLSDYKGVLVVAEQKRGLVQSVSYELLGVGKRLAEDTGGVLSAVLIGKNIESQAKKLIAYGADKVFLIQSDKLEIFNDESYSAVLCRLIREQKPEIVIAGATCIGRALVPRVAVELKTGPDAPCFRREHHGDHPLQ
jgi:electron transfer flavoprotein alpha/beta subunit